MVRGKGTVCRHKWQPRITVNLTAGSAWFGVIPKVRVGRQGWYCVKCGVSR